MIKRMKRIDKKILFLFLPVFIILVVFLCTFIHNYNGKNIDKVLESSNYSYLPKEAKNYIKSVYEETGEILLTEKNKKENVEYLNPTYVDYLTLSETEQKEQEVIPEPVVIDYIYEKDNSQINDKLPSTFDLRDVNGKNFVTPLKDQGSLGICWAYASVAQVESYLLVKANKTSDETAEIFSERQIDYATAKDGLIDTASWYSRGLILGDGGNFSNFMDAGMDGFALADSNWKYYGYMGKDKLEAREVYNFSNSKYELDGGIDIPKLNLDTLNLSNQEDSDKREDYLNKFKSLIVANGGAFVSTTDPVGRCSIFSNGSRLLYKDGYCSGGGHAMQVIGWDDNYEYSFCSGVKDKYNSKYYALNTDISSCDEGTVISKKGAWILKNSWGDNSNAAYVYLAYDSKDSAFSVVTEVAERTWDNYYSKPENTYYLEYHYTKKFSSSEKLHKFKAKLGKQNAKYDLYISRDGNRNNYEKIDSITTDMPMYYTFDLSDKNIVLDNPKFSFKIEGGQVEKPRVYTDNIIKDYFIHTDDSVYKNSITHDNRYILRVSSVTSGINSNETVDYKLFDSSHNAIDSNLYSYTDNTVFANKVYSKFFIDSSVPKGEYILQTIYDGEIRSTSKIIIDRDIVVTEGNGTYSSPYLIKTAEQLDLVRLNSKAFYRLDNDIDLTFATQNKDGIFYNDGKGWNPIEYSDGGLDGVFDGNGYTIKGLYINRPDEDYVGLFRKTYNQSMRTVQISNLHLRDVNITGRNYVGAVLGYANGVTYERILRLQNLSVESGIVKGKNYVGGVFGHLYAGSDMRYTGDSYRHFISNIYNAATVEAEDYAGGISGFVSNIYHYGVRSPIEVLDIQNMGTVKSSTHAGGLFGCIEMRENNSILIQGFINTGDVIAQNAYGIAPPISSSSVGKLNLTNGFYINERGFQANDMIVSSKVEKQTIQQLRVKDNYSSFAYFSSHWNLQSVDNIIRIPILKHVHFDYTEDIMDFDLGMNSSIRMQDYIKPMNDLAYNVHYSIDDESVAKVDKDGTIIPVKEGITTLHFLSYYDGYEKDILIRVVDNAYKIKFDSNGGAGIMEDQEALFDTSFQLSKNIFTKKNYIFKEWNTKPDGTGIRYQDSESIRNIANPKETITLYAIWEPGKYTIIYDSNGVNGNTYMQDIRIDETVSLMDNAFDQKNYIFKEWNTKKDGTGDRYQDGASVINLAAMDKVITLYAIWEPGKYHVIYDSNGGDGIMPEQLVLIDQTVQLQVHTFTKNNYRFIEWNTKSDGTGTSYYEGDSFQNLTDNGEEIILYAIWEPGKYHVIYDGNGATGDMNHQEILIDAVDYVLINQYKKEGYRFKEWNTRKDGKGISYFEGQEVTNLVDDFKDITLYAIWERMQYTIVFDANSESFSGEMSKQTIFINQKTSLKANTFNNGDFIFKCWNTKSDGTGSSYYDGQQVENIGKDGETITLYAIWTNHFFDLHNYKQDKNYIKNINEKTTAFDYYKQFEVVYGYEVKVFNKEKDKNGFIKYVEVDKDDIIVSGSVLKVFQDGKEKDCYINVVRGDVNGDGKVSVIDISKLFKFIIDDEFVMEDYFIGAGDVNDDGRASVIDISKMFAYILGKILIL